MCFAVLKEELATLRELWLVQPFHQTAGYLKEEILVLDSKREKKFGENLEKNAKNNFIFQTAKWVQKWKKEPTPAVTFNFKHCCSFND